MTISEAYDARLQNALAAGLTLDQAKDAVDMIEEAEFRVEAQFGPNNKFCFWGITLDHITFANVWGAAGTQPEQYKLARLFAASPDMLKALNAIIDAAFDCMTDEQFAAMDLVEAALKKAEDSAE
jgi:hypothetical protein